MYNSSCKKCYLNSSCVKYHTERKSRKNRQKSEAESSNAMMIRKNMEKEEAEKILLPPEHYVELSPQLRNGTGAYPIVQGRVKTLPYSFFC